MPMHTPETPEAASSQTLISRRNFLYAAVTAVALSCSGDHSRPVLKQVGQTHEDAEKILLPHLEQLQHREKIFDIPFLVNGHEVIFREDLSVMVDGTRFICESLNVSGTNYSASLIRTGNPSVRSCQGACFDSILGSATVTEEEIGKCAEALAENKEADSPFEVEIPCTTRAIPALAAMRSIVGAVRGVPATNDIRFVATFKRKSEPSALELTSR